MDGFKIRAGVGATGHGLVVWWSSERVLGIGVGNRRVREHSGIAMASGPGSSSGTGFTGW